MVKIADYYEVIFILFLFLTLFYLGFPVVKTYIDNISYTLYPDNPVVGLYIIIFFIFLIGYGLYRQSGDG